MRNLEGDGGIPGGDYLRDLSTIRLRLRVVIFYFLF